MTLPRLCRLPSREPQKVLVFDGEFRPTSFRDPRWGLCDMVIASWKHGLEDEPIYTVNLTRKAQDAAFDSGDFSLWKKILTPAHKAICEADLIITHNGPRFDWGRMLSEFARVRLPLPEGKKFHDTLDHRFKGKGFPRSLEALGEFYDSPYPKKGMSETAWMSVWQLTPKGIIEGRERCEADIKLQVFVYKAACEAGHMGTPKTVKAFR